MNLAANGIRFVRRSGRIGLVVLAPLVAAAAAGEKNHKGGGPKANHAARIAAAPDHKAMLRQQAALQNNAAQGRMLAQAAGTGGRHHEAEVGGTNAGIRHNGVGGVHRNGTNQNRNMETGPMLSSLRSVAGHLHQADHDYDGHRVQAIHQVDQAIRSLQAGGGGAGANGVGTGGNHPHAGANGVGTGGTGGRLGGSNGTGQRMAQAQSDAHLREAHQELLTLESRMTGGGAGGKPAAHHQQAHGHIRQAIQHLNTALATR